MSCTHCFPLFAAQIMQLICKLPRICNLKSGLLIFIRTNVYICRVMSNLKEYAVKALVNTVDHLGSISFKVSSLVDQRFDEVTEANMRVSCIQQVLENDSSQ